MKHYLKPVFMLSVFVLIAANSAFAETEMVIALKTDKFELTETDISTLAIGEAKTIETDSGSIIDILRTAEGAEIYVDGELLEMDFDYEGKHVEVICEDDNECDEHVIIVAGGEEDINIEELHEMHNGEEGHKVIVIKKQINTQD